MLLHFLDCDRRPHHYCSIEPVTAAALIGAGGALGGGALSFMGGQSQSKAIRQAMERYIQELNNQRQTFLDQPESQAIRSKLQSYIGGDVGYSPDTVETMRKGTYEDYGKGLADMTRLTGKAGAASTGVYTPGRADRTSRLLGQNLAANRATQMRDITTKNADVALNNQRLAVSALPTYLPGLPATQVAGPDVYAKAGETPNWGSYLGPALNQAGQQYANLSVLGPIMQKMLASQNDPLTQAYLMNQMSPMGYQRMFPVPQFDSYRSLSPTS